MPEQTILFDREELDHVVQQIGGFLAELAYIDKALEYIRLNDDRHNRLIAEKEEIEIHLGDLYPFTKFLTLPSDWRNQQNVSNHLTELSEEANTWADREIETLLYYASWITRPEVRSYDHIVAQLEEVHRFIHDEIDNDIGQIDEVLDDWKGTAAGDFRSNFYRPFTHIRDNQISLTMELAQWFAYSRGVTQLAQHSLMTAAVHTRKALREQLKKRMEDAYDTPSLKEILILTSSATNLMAAFGVPFAAETSAIMDFAAVSIPESAAEPYQIEGVSADKLCNDLFDATRLILRNARTGYSGMEYELASLAARMSDLQENNRLWPKQPVLVDGVDSESFHHRQSSSEYQG